MTQHIYLIIFLIATLFFSHLTYDFPFSIISKKKFDQLKNVAAKSEKFLFAPSHSERIQA